MSNIFWSGVSVDVQSALATAVTITGITKANPAVVSHSGTDPSNGDYVLMAIQGMNEINNRIFRVANQSVGSFELEGVDSTSFGTFTSGTFAVITFGTSLSTVVNVSPSGGDPVTVPTQTIHDVQQIESPVSSSALTFSMESKFDPTDASLSALKSASDSLAQRAVKFTFSGGEIVLFYGYVSFPFIPTGQAQGLVTSPLSFLVSAPVTTYSA